MASCRLTRIKRQIEFVLLGAFRCARIGPLCPLFALLRARGYPFIAPAPSRSCGPLCALFGAGVFALSYYCTFGRGLSVFSLMIGCGNFQFLGVRFELSHALASIVFVYHKHKKKGLPLLPCCYYSRSLNAPAVRSWAGCSRGFRGCP